MNKIHDPNLSLADLEKVLETTKTLGETSKKAISGQRTDLIGRIHTTMNPGSQETLASVTTPDGKVFTFPDQQSADQFKQAAGIQ